jgi:hypothetical protein
MGREGYAGQSTLPSNVPDSGVSLAVTEAVDHQVLSLMCSRMVESQQQQQQQQQTLPLHASTQIKFAKLKRQLLEV